MKIISACAATAIALLGVTGAQAAESEKSFILRVFNDDVAPADQTAYEAAIRSYTKCLAANHFKHGMAAYGHETGNTYEYSFVFGHLDWPALDGMADVVKACNDTWRTQGNSHLKSETSVLLQAEPQYSYVPRNREPRPALVNVTSFELKKGPEAEQAFTDSFRKFREAAQKSSWSGNYVVYKVIGGDPHAPQYVVMSAYKNWEAFGEGGIPGAMKMMEATAGKESADAFRKSVDDNIVTAYSHVNSIIENLSYFPPKEN